MILVYKILHAITLWALPTLLILSSFAYMLPNAEAHKRTLRASGIYSRLSTALQQSTVPEQIQNFQTVLVWTVTTELATEEWLQQVAEQNIDLTTAWLRGQEQDWVFYLPTDQIQKAVVARLDSQTQELVQQRQSQIPTCDPDQANSIREQGFDLSEDFCLPQAVKEGQETLTEFLNLNNPALQNNVLSSVVQDNPLNTLTDRFKVSTLDTAGSAGRETTSRLTFARDVLVSLRNNLWLLWLLWTALLLVDLAMAKAANKTWNKEISRVLWIGAINTLSLSIVWVLFAGGSAYLSSSINAWLFPGIAITELRQTFLWAMVWLSFNLVSLAIWIALGMLAGFALVRLADKMDLFGGISRKNAKLQKSTVPGAATNTTLDGAFLEIVSRKAESDLLTTKTTARFDPKTVSNFSMPAKVTPGLDFTEDVLTDSHLPSPTVPGQVPVSDFTPGLDFAQPDSFDTSTSDTTPTWQASQTLNTYNTPITPSYPENLRNIQAESTTSADQTPSPSPAPAKDTVFGQTSEVSKSSIIHTDPKGPRLGGL